MLGILQQNKELSSHAPHQKIEKKPLKTRLQVFSNFNIY